MSTFQQSIFRHGFLPTILRTIYNRIRRIVDFEICTIACNSGDPYDWPYPAEYETRVVEGDEFNRCLSTELSDKDYDFAFQRSDQCVASIHGESIVGYTFYTQYPTRVRDGIEFRYPDSYVYSYASLTAPAHRGHKLERNRWKAAREERVRRTSQDPPVIWYNNVMNLEILAATASSGDVSITLGYTGYVNLFGRWICFQSPSAARLGAGFVRTD